VGNHEPQGEGEASAALRQFQACSLFLRQSPGLPLLLGEGRGEGECALRLAWGLTRTSGRALGSSSLCSSGSILPPVPSRTTARAWTMVKSQWICPSSLRNFTRLMQP
jgi:hypothetical protein